MEDNRLVYSTDPARNQKCPACGELIPACRCGAKKNIQTVACECVLRIEKAHRGGKTVTVIDRLPARENWLKDLAKTLKAACGTGGTYFMEGGTGRIEIQGDKREPLRALLAKQGIRVKG